VARYHVALSGSSLGSVVTGKEPSACPPKRHYRGWSRREDHGDVVAGARAVGGDK
jgi:hypothetical protein